MAGNWQPDQYAGTVHDGVGALRQFIMQADDKVALICIGRCPILPLRWQGSLRSQANYGMQHPARLPDAKAHAEFNAKMHALACRAPEARENTPLDTCGNVILDGERFAAIRRHERDATLRVRQSPLV